MFRNLRWAVYFSVGVASLVGWACLRFPTVVVDETFAATPRRKPELAGFRMKIDKLAPQFDPLPKPQAGDWLAKYPEGGQTFDQYVAGRKRPIRAECREIHLLPLGEFTPAESKLLKQTAEFMEAF